MERNSYLINKYMKSYMLASIMTMAVLSINGVIDSIILGQYVSPDALSAINVSAPITTFISSMAALLSGGAVILVSHALGRREYSEASKIFVTVIISVFIMALCFGVASIFITDYLANVLSLGNELFPLVKEYLSIFLFSAGLIMLNNCIDSMVDVGGNPQLVTQSSVVNAAVNLLGDVVFIIWLGIGIKGAAISTLCGAIASILWMSRFLMSSRSPYKMTLEGLEFGKYLAENIKNGIPPMFSSLSGVILMTACNFFIQDAQGKDGMFALSINWEVMALSMLLASGCGMAFASIGGNLYGRRDFIGLRMLYNKCFAWGVCSTFIIVVLININPEPIVRLFGAEEPLVIEKVCNILPIVSWFLVSMALMMFLTVVYQVIGKIEMCTPAVLSLPAILIIYMTYNKFMGQPDDIWYGFPIAGFGAVAITLFMSEYIRRTSEEKYSFISMLPIVSKEKNFAASIPCSIDGVKDNMNNIIEFCQKNNISNTMMDNILHCIEELTLNIVEHSGRNSKDYIDIGITINGKEIEAFVQDNGKPFDPVNFKLEGAEVGLRMLHKYCQDLSYNYSFGQNVTFLKWKNE